MKVKMLVDKAWSIDFKKVEFKADEVVDVRDDIAAEMIELGYAEELSAKDANANPDPDPEKDAGPTLEELQGELEKLEEAGSVLNEKFKRAEEDLTKKPEKRKFIDRVAKAKEEIEAHNEDVSAINAKIKALEDKE